MTLSRGDVRNILALLLAQFTAVLIGLFAFTRIGRVLPVQELGRFGFAISSTAFFGLLAELGVRYVAMKEIAVNPSRARHVYIQGARMRWLLAAVALLLLWIFSGIPSWRAERPLLMLAGLVAMSQFGSDPATWVFFGRGRVDVGAAILVVDRLYYLLCIHLAAWIVPSAEGLVAGALVANLSRLGTSAVLLRRYLPSDSTEAAWDGELFRRLFAHGLAIGVAIVLAVANSQFSVVLVGACGTPIELGYYAMAFGITNVLLVIPTSFVMALFPVMARTTSAESGTRRTLFEWVARLSLASSLPIAVGLALFASPVLVLWMGVQYTPATLHLRLLAAYVAFGAATFMYRLFFFVAEMYRTEIVISSISILTVAVVGVPVYRHYRGAGMAAVVIGVEALAMLVKWASLRKWLGDPPCLSLLARSSLAVLLPSALVFVLADHSRLAVRSAVYAGGCAMLMVLFRILPSRLPSERRE